MTSKVLLVLVCKLIAASLAINKYQSVEFVYNLTNYAIESRRIRNPCIYEEDYFACLKKLTSQNSPSQQNYPLENPQRPYIEPQRPYIRPYLSPARPYLRPLRPYLGHENPHSVLEVLDTISRNDALRCVPRLLCEVTSDTISRGRQSSFTLPTLPFNIDMGSIIRILSTIDFPGGSPVTIFAKAALLGYVSKGNSDSCLDAYPTCPKDPNKLVQYLNNYNGGFFRFFNGVSRRPSSPGFAQKRIQNVGRVQKSLTFPKDDNTRFNEFVFKKPKELPFGINEYYSNELDFQKPLPNHKATPIIFPLRTGTGDLRLDPEELDANYKLQSNFVSFNVPDIYYREPEATSTRTIFSFPV